MSERGVFMYKLIAIDLDGTLLNSKGEVSDATKQALKKAMDSGIEIVLASGRTIESIENIANEIGTIRYIISGNGAAVYDIKEEKVIYSNFLSKSQVLKIATLCEENSIHYNVYTEKEIIAKNLSYNVLYYHKENLKKPENRRTYINIVPDMIDYIKNLENENFLKITVCDEDIKIFNSIIKKIKLLDKFDVLDVEYMSRKKIKCGTEEVLVEYYYTEISNENVNKWTAIEFLMNKLNITLNEVIAIGDNFNDRKMIENSGLGIVMGNSSPFLKICGDLIVTDNDSDGVCEAIEKYILKN
jgi:hypothetical protein